MTVDIAVGTFFWLKKRDAWVGSCLAPRPIFRFWWGEECEGGRALYGVDICLGLWELRLNYFRSQS